MDLLSQSSPWKGVGTRTIPAKVWNKNTVQSFLCPFKWNQLTKNNPSISRKTKAVLLLKPSGGQWESFPILPARPSASGSHQPTTPNREQDSLNNPIESLCVCVSYINYTLLSLNSKVCEPIDHRQGKLRVKASWSWMNQKTKTEN